jgi:hypothetical protein
VFSEFTLIFLSYSIADSENFCRSYIQGVSTIKRYFKYKNELKSLLRTLDTESNIFQNSCEELLEGLVPASRMAALLKEPGGELWKDASIERRLRNRLQSSYSGYLQTVDDMELVMDEFKSRLKLSPDGKVRHGCGLPRGPPAP